MVDKSPEQLVEFRNYEIVPGGIDAFVQHFEEHFLESQEELGMDVVGQFRVADDPQRFVCGAAPACLPSSPRVSASTGRLSPR
jgi:NIPSNAP